MIDAEQLSKDILASRLETIAYNETVLSGCLLPCDLRRQVAQIKAIEVRIKEWRKEWQ